MATEGRRRQRGFCDEQTLVCWWRSSSRRYSIAGSITSHNSQFALHSFRASCSRAGGENHAMVEDMARPAKRRKVAASEPVPTLAHSVEDLPRIERVEEVHMQIQHLPWHKRQASAVVSTLTSVDAAGSSVVETITVGADPSAATSVVPTLSSSSSSSNSTSALSTGASSGLTTTCKSDIPQFYQIKTN